MTEAGGLKPLYHAQLHVGAKSTCNCNHRLNNYIAFEVFLVVTVKNVIFGNVAPCRSCEKRFGGTCHLHLQGRKYTSEEQC
jgi:hypothetical protein